MNKIVAETFFSHVVLSRTVADDISCLICPHQFREGIMLVSHEIDYHYAFYLFSRNILFDHTIIEQLLKMLNQAFFDIAIL